ncbi:hypothetical protein [Nocardioides bizhenqiangii]|uniref:Uncharacterized protein n=1 Tax=Nocardioides bizhenqiangii TaxID=3095076 RepID=A0ABZ0ZT41_9ACTN|nr:hypothetical protein [Nocardioides sp. HM61]WQQ26822.1 hypothetical protein SHK19_00985 [Nocardioides sp. HM61]
MPASTKHILINVERMAADDELLKLWNEIAQAKNDDGTERTLNQSWTAFVAAADAAHIADRIPGTVGRTFKTKYAAEPQPKKPAAKRTTTRKTTTKAAK